MSHIPPTRRVLTVASNGQVSVKEEPLPRPGPGEVLVRVRTSLISPGTELSRFEGVDRSQPAEGEPIPFGYQNAGEIVQVGEGCTQLRPGQRVACMGWGKALHADYACIAQNLAVPLPDGVSHEEGAFIALGATAIHAVRRARPTLGDYILVGGLGIVGQMTAQLSAMMGSFPLGSDPTPLRVELAQRCGVDATTSTGETLVEEAKAFTRERGMDGAFICFGGDVTGPLRHMVRTLKYTPDRHRMGWVTVVGQAGMRFSNFVGEMDNVDLISVAHTGPGYKDPDYETGSDYTPVFIRWTTRDNMALFLDLVEKKKVNVANLITDRYSIEQANEACYALIDEPTKHLGIVIEYPD